MKLRTQPTRRRAGDIIDAIIDRFADRLHRPAGYRRALADELGVGVGRLAL